MRNLVAIIPIATNGEYDEAMRAIRYLCRFFATGENNKWTMQISSIQGTPASLDFMGLLESIANHLGEDITKPSNGA